MLCCMAQLYVFLHIVTGYAANIANRLKAIMQICLPVIFHSSLVIKHKGTKTTTIEELATMNLVQMAPVFIPGGEFHATAVVNTSGIVELAPTFLVAFQIESLKTACHTNGIVQFIVGQLFVLHILMPCGELHWTQRT